MKPIEVLIKLDLICWNTLLFGWKNSWVNRESIASYAAGLLSEGVDNNDENIALMAANSSLDDDEILSLLEKLCDNADDDVIDKWRLSNLICIAEVSMSDQEKIDAVQEVYAKFDYPEDMASCSIYTQDNQDPLMVMVQVIESLKSKFGV